MSQCDSLPALHSILLPLSPFLPAPQNSCSSLLHLPTPYQTVSFPKPFLDSPKTSLHHSTPVAITPSPVCKSAEPSLNTPFPFPKTPSPLQRTQYSLSCPHSDLSNNRHHSSNSFPCLIRSIPNSYISIVTLEHSGPSP